MSYERLGAFVAAKKAHLLREKMRLSNELTELLSLERSPLSVAAGGLGGAIGGMVGRVLSGQPLAALGSLPFADKLSGLMQLNQLDFLDDALGDMNPLSGQVFGKLMSLTAMDPNRALFDIAQRGAEDLKRRLGVGESFMSDLMGSVTQLRDQIAVVAPSQGGWFSGVGGFKESIVSAVKDMDGVGSALDLVKGKLEQEILPLQEDLDAVKTAMLGIREKLVPLNASLRPQHGADHPQVNELVAIAQLKTMRDKALALLDNAENEATFVAQQKSGLAAFKSSANTRTKGASLTKEMAKVFRRFSEDTIAMKAQLGHAAGSGGVAEVFSREESWITQIETMLAVLDRPLLQLGTTSEDGGGEFDTQTAVIEEGFDTMAANLNAVGDIDFSSLKDSVQQFGRMASSALGGSGFGVAEVDSVLSTITSQVGSLQAKFSDITSAVDLSDFLDGRVPHLDQVTSFVDSLKGGQFDSALGLLTSGSLFDAGMAMLNVRSIDSKGRFAQELRALAGSSTQGVKELNRQRVERVHRVLETDERRKRRLALSYEDAIEEAKKEVEYEQLKLGELERELDRVESGLV